ncbi:hypothetical protein SDC9_71497 [bioreactor metagenome]|uniref:Uncharacterized protein n=1 Tax=bioreactor metagenome TaxID=1076179 RepID=A0A644YAQ4_9ZZZZ
MKHVVDIGAVRQRFPRDDDRLELWIDIVVVRQHDFPVDADLFASDQLLHLASGTISAFAEQFVQSHPASSFLFHYFAVLPF